MRKSFTRLFSIFVLLLGLSLQLAYGIVFDGTTSVPINANANANPTTFATKFVVAFDLAPVITDAGGTVVIYKNGGLFKTLPISKTSANVVVVGKTIEITHGITSFVQSDVYSVVITDGAITSLPAGNLAFGVYSFTIGDYVAPNLVTTAASFTPNKGAVDVMATLNSFAFTLTIPFNEAVTVPAAANKLNVYIYKEDGTVVDIIKVGSIATGTTLGGLNSANITVPVANTAIFQENTKYYVSVDAGAFVDISPNKNAFGGLSDKTVWTFTTRDNSAPAISAKSVTSITATSAVLNVTLAEKGKYYYLVQLASVAAPTAVTVSTTGVAVTVATAGTNVTANLAALAGGVDYKVYIVSENSVTVGAPVVGTTVENVAFKTVDNTAPSAVARGILNDASKKTYALYMVFDEEIKGGAGTLDVRKTVAPEMDSYIKQVGANLITSVKLTTAAEVAKYPGAVLNNWVTVIDLGMTLPSKVGYYVVFPSGYIKDVAGNNFAGAGAFIVPINKGDWGFTSNDFEIPTVTVTWANAASLSSDINITFNETIQKQLATTTDWAQVISLELNNTPVAFTVTSPAAAGTGTVIVVDPTPAALTSKTTYTIRLRKDAVMDMAASPNSIVTEGVYSLTTGDLDAFTVQYGSSVGATATTNLLAASTLRIKFNKAVKVNTTGTTWVDATNTNLAPFITLNKTGAPSAGVKTFAVAYDAATFTATITPTDALICNASDYVLALDGTKVRDAQSILLTGAAGYAPTTTYTVKDYNAPVAALSHSGDMAAATPLTITFTDDNIATLANLSGTLLSAMTSAQLTALVTLKNNDSNGANVTITSVAYAAGVLTLTPAVGALVVGNTYYYGIGTSVKDGAGNITADKFGTFKVVTAPVSPVIVANTYTINGSAQTPVATKLINIVHKTGNIISVTVTFNDNVKEVNSTAPFNTVSLTDGITTWTANVTPTNVSGNTLTVDFTGVTLASEVLGTITLPAGIVQGSTAYTNTPVPTFAQFAGKTITFDTKDVVAPTVTANVPGAGAAGIAVNTPISVNLSEKVVLGTGSILIKEGATVIQTIPVNSTNVNLNVAGTLATITKLADLPKHNVTYTLEIPVTAFTDDISLNNLAAVYSGTFTTVVNPQPTAVAPYVPADNADLVATGSPLSLGITFSEEVIKYDPLVGTRKLWYLVKEVGAIRASFTGTDDLTLNGGTDVVVANNYIETSSVGISGKNVTIATGFSPVAGERYYVLITPGAFLDKSIGTTSPPANPVPGVYGGVTSATTWNFTTIDENPGTVTFVYTNRADGKVDLTSDLTINFSRPIKKADGTAITSADIANLFTLTKLTGSGTLGAKAFIGTISEDKKTVKVLNSSLVTLGELTALSSYTLAMNAGAILYQNGAAVAGASNTFFTSDYTVPVVTASIAAAVADVTAVDAKITFSSTDNQNLARLWYVIQEGTLALTALSADAVKTGQSVAIAGVGPVVSTYTFTGLKEKTSYVVSSVAVDDAGNTSVVNRLLVTTDDVTKPLMATLPTAFDATNQLTFIFNENVSPVAGAVRVLDTNMQVIAVLNLIADPAVPANPKLLKTSAFAGLATSNTLVNYYIEIDKGLVGDIPVVAGDAINYYDGLFRTDLMVTSKDVTLPVLTSSTPTLPATAQPVTASIKLNFSEAVQKVAVLPVDAFVVEKEIGVATYEPFEVVDPVNVVTNGTNVVTLNVSRALSSATTYRITVKLQSFRDLAGNVSAVGTLQGLYTTADVLAPVVTYTPANAATGVLITTPNLTLSFNEAIRLLDNSPIDNYDLDSLVYVKKGSVAQKFKAAFTGGNLITITLDASNPLVKDAEYTYGFKAKFEDTSNNALAAGSATFKTELTSAAAMYLTWTPAKANPYAAPWPWLGNAAPITLTFVNPIYTLRPAAVDNNLPVTATYLANTALSVTKNGVGMAAADLLFTVIDNKTVSVAPKAGANWGSGSIIEVTLNAGTIQISEGASGVAVPTDVSKYQGQDVVAPKVDLTYAVAPFVTGYYPANVGLAGVSPVIAKDQSLKLYFDEDVKAGTGVVTIHRWDGVLVKTMPAPVVAADKRTVTLGALTPGLDTNQEYYVIVNSGAVVDVTDNNPYAGITAVKTWKFILKDDNIPVVSNFMPMVSNTPVDTKLTINFDRPVALSTTTGYVALYKSAVGGDAVQIWRAVEFPGAFAISGSTATITINNLEPNTMYHVEVAAGTFGSSADVTKTNAAVTRSSWMFTTEVNAAPVLIAAGQLPANNATDVMVNTGLEMTFNMPVEAGTGNIQLHAADGSVIYNFDVKGTDVVFMNEVVKVTLPMLLENKQYYVIVPTTAIRNKTFTPEYFAGITVPYTWKFNTQLDATVPTVIATPNTTTNAPGTLAVELKFSEVVNNVTTTTVTVAGGTLKTLVQSLTDTKIWNVTLSAADMATATLSLSNAIADLVGNKLAPISWDYKFGDNTAPTVVANSTKPMGTVATYKDLAFEVKFSEVVMAGSGLITIKNTLDNSVTATKDVVFGTDGTVTFAPATALTFASYQVVIAADAVKDANNNFFNPTGFTWNLNIADTDAPKVSGLSPVDGTMGLLPSVDLKITFDQEVMLGDVGAMIKVYKQGLAGNSLVYSTAITAANLSSDMKTVSISVANLTDLTSYTVLVDAGLVKDEAGNKFAGIADPTTWNFETGDNTAPSVVSTTTASATNAANTFDVLITFSEDVTGVAANITAANGTVSVTGSGKAYVANIKAVDAAVVTMTIGTGIKDASGRNSLAAAVVRTYTVGDNTAPTVSVTPPATPVAQIFTVKLAFNEMVTGVSSIGGGVVVTGGKLESITGSGKDYTLTVSANEQTAVSIALTDAIKDMSPNTNKFAGLTLNYTTGDFTKPEMLVWTPSLDEVTANNHPTFKITFSENVVIGAGGSLKVYKVATSTPALTIPVTAAMINGKEVTITYAATQSGLDKNTRYYVLLDGSAIKDIAGNAFAGVTDVAAWTFRTGASFLTGVDPKENGSLEFKVYPNPFVDYVNVDRSSELSKVVVTNIAGQVVKEVVRPANRIQLNELRSGVYFISLYNMDNVVAKTAKIIKN